VNVLVLVGSDGAPTQPPPPPGSVDEDLADFLAGKQNARILVVDDDTPIQDILAEVLRDEGYEVDTAGDGYEALGKLVHGPRPDCILLDMMLPKLSGKSVWRAIDTEPGLRDIPVLVITAHAYRLDISDSDERVIYIGTHRESKRPPSPVPRSTPPEVIRKPIMDIPAFLAAVRRAIEKGRPSRG